MMTFTFEYEAGRGPDWDSTAPDYRPQIVCTSATSARLQQALPTLGWGADAAGRPCVAYDEISPVFHSALRGLDLEAGAHLSKDPNDSNMLETRVGFPARGTILQLNVANMLMRTIRPLAAILNIKAHANRLLVLGETIRANIWIEIRLSLCAIER
jgi:hypothetical protein